LHDDVEPQVDSTRAVERKKMCRCKMFSGPPFRHSSLV